MSTSRTQQIYIGQRQSAGRFCRSRAFSSEGLYAHKSRNGSKIFTVCLDNLTDAFGGGACNMASSLAGCLHSVGYDMPRVCDVIPMLDVDNIIEVLTAQLQDLGNGALYCPRVPPTRGVVSCTYEQCFRPYTLRRRFCHLLCLAGACSAFCRLGLVAMACLLLMVVLLALLMLTGLKGCANLAMLVILGT